MGCVERHSAVPTMVNAVGSTNGYTTDKTLVWNVHGLNALVRRNAVCQVVRAAGPTIVCAQETKVQLVTDALVKQCFGNRFEKYYY